MNLLSLSWSYVRHRWLNTFLNTLLLALGTGLIVYLLLVMAQVQAKMQADAKGINLVVGAKGSPLQLILCSIFHIDNPTGNISLADADRIAANRRFVKKAMPLALGDSYGAFRIVGTTRAYPDHYDCQLAQGRWWHAPLETTLGAEVARRGGLAVGDTFHGAHGLDGNKDNAHESHSYKVVGILKPSGTVVDRLVLTALESVWAVHEHHAPAPLVSGREGLAPLPLGAGGPADPKGREITSLLVVYKNVMANLAMPRLVNGQSNLQAASPAMELVRLYELFGVGVDVVQYLAYTIILIAGLSIFVALYNALKDRRYELAIMRTLGASQNKVVAHIALEGLLLACLGGVFGLLLGHGAVELTGRLLSDTAQASLSGWAFVPAEWAVLAGVLGVGLVAALLPALQTYRMDIADTLAG